MCTVLLPTRVNPVAVNKIYQYRYQVVNMSIYHM